MSAHGHAEHSHRPVWHYVVVAVVLGLITLFEIGPLFNWYNIPAPVLLVLSAVKFIIVVALFMHLWDDSKVYTTIFGPPLVGSGLMVLVLITLFWGFFPSPADDDAAIQERYWTDYSGKCNSWLRSHTSNRWYCASPALDGERIAMAYRPAPTVGPVTVDPDLTGKSPDEAKVMLVDAGKAVYAGKGGCVACHQAEGQGIPGAFPPLAKSDYITDPVVHIKTVLKGLNGPITVNGQPYNGAMQAFAGTLSDFEVAAVVTYERSSFGNELGVVMPDQVKAAR